MGWKVSVVLDEGTNIASLQILIGQMPVWARATAERQAALSQLNEEFSLFWTPEPAFTVFSANLSNDPLVVLLNLIPIMAEHHPMLSGLHLIGVEASPNLLNGLSAFGYTPVPDSDAVYTDRIRFAKPLDQIPNMPQIVLDGCGWQKFDDFYDAFFAAVGAPKWHGRNFNALDDSIGEGGINRLEVPYRIVIYNSNKMSAELTALIKDLSDLIHHLQGEGCPVDLVIAPF